VQVISGVATAIQDLVTEYLFPAVLVTAFELFVIIDMVV
jgi:hypothetical protein